MRTLIIATCLLGICHCGRVAGDDNATGDAAGDQAPAGPWDCGDAGLPKFPAPCDDPAACQAWQQSFIHHGTVHTMCGGLSGGLPKCWAADHDVSSGGFDDYECGNGLGCAALHQICVSDTPGGTPHCVKPCSQ